MSKTRLFRATQWPPYFDWLNNNFIIIYHTYSGMTVKTEYIPTILVLNNLWHYFDAAFLFKTLKSTEINNSYKQWGQIDNSETGTSAIKLTEYIQHNPKELHYFSPKMLLLLCTPWTVYTSFNPVSVNIVCICHLSQSLTWSFPTMFSHASCLL